MNGQRPPPAGMEIDPEKDRVTLHGEPVTAPPTRHTYLALHKPVGVITSAVDPQGRTTIFDLIRDFEGARRLFSVGRLDYETSGLILLTDDGRLANRLSHPSSSLGKEYLVTVKGVVEEGSLRRLREGVMLDGRPTRPAQVEVLAAHARLTRLKVVIKEGRYRQVRRMFEAVGHPVQELSRQAIGPLRLGRLKAGHWRKLKEAEVSSLQAAALSR